MKQQGSPRRRSNPTSLRTSRHKSRGQSLVEFALVFPVFILLLSGMIDFGFGFYQYMTLINQARVGARFAILDPANTSAIINAAQTAGITSASVSVSCWSVAGNGGATAPAQPPGTAGWGSCTTTGSNPTKTGDTVSVTVSYTYHMIWPLTFGTTIPLSSNMQMAVE